MHASTEQVCLLPYRALSCDTFISCDAVSCNSFLSRDTVVLLRWCCHVKQHCLVTQHFSSLFRDSPPRRHGMPTWTMAPTTAICVTLPTVPGWLWASMASRRRQTTPSAPSTHLTTVPSTESSCAIMGCGYAMLRSLNCIYIYIYMYIYTVPIPTHKYCNK